MSSPTSDRAAAAREEISKLLLARNRRALRRLADGLPATLDVAYERHRARALALALEGRTDEAVVVLNLASAAAPRPAQLAADVEELRAIARGDQRPAVVASLRSDDRFRVALGALALALAVFSFVVLPGEIVEEGGKPSAAPAAEPRSENPPTVEAAPTRPSPEAVTATRGVTRPRAAASPARLVGRRATAPSAGRSRAPAPAVTPEPTAPPPSPPITQPPAPPPAAPTAEAPTSSPTEVAPPPMPTSVQTAANEPTAPAAARGKGRIKQKPKKNLPPSAATASEAPPPQEPATEAPPDHAASKHDGPPGQDPDHGKSPPGKEKGSKK